MEVVATGTTSNIALENEGGKLVLIDYGCNGEYINPVFILGNDGYYPNYSVPQGAPIPGENTPNLPKKDNNDITGNWSPSNTIDTTTIGTFIYTFIPDPGQCALSQSWNMIIYEYNPYG
jgi:hypothetical protein